MQEVEQMRHDYSVRKSFLVQLYNQSYTKENLLQESDNYLLLLVDLLTNPKNGKNLDVKARNSIYDMINFYRDIVEGASDKAYEKINEAIVLANNLEPFNPNFYQEQYEMRFPFLKRSDIYGQNEAQRQSIYDALLVDVSVLLSLKYPMEKYLNTVPIFKGNMFYLATLYTFLKEFPEIFTIGDYKGKLLVPLFLNQQDNYEELLDKMFHERGVYDRKKEQKVISSHKKLVKQIQNNF